MYATTYVSWPPVGAQRSLGHPKRPKPTLARATSPKSIARLKLQKNIHKHHKRPRLALKHHQSINATSPDHSRRIRKRPQRTTLHARMVTPLRPPLRLLARKRSKRNAAPASASFCCSASATSNC